MKFVPHMKGGAVHLIDKNQLIQIQQQQVQHDFYVSDNGMDVTNSPAIDLKVNVEPSGVESEIY